MIKRYRNEVHVNTHERAFNELLIPPDDDPLFVRSAEEMQEKLGLSITENHHQRLGWGHMGFLTAGM